MLKKNSNKRKTYKRKTYKRKTYRRKNGGTLARAFSPVTKTLIPAGKFVAKGAIDGTTRVLGDVGMNLSQQAFNNAISSKHTINPVPYNFKKTYNPNFVHQEYPPTYNIAPIKIMTPPSRPFQPPSPVEFPDDEY